MSGLITKKTQSRRRSAVSSAAADSAAAQVDKLFAKVQADFDFGKADFEGVLESLRRSEESVLQTETAALRSALDARQNDHRSSLQNLERLRAMHAEHVQRIGELEGERDRLQAALGDQERKLRVMQKSLHEAEESIFEHNVAQFEIQQKYEGLQAEVADAKAGHEQAARDLDMAQTRYESLRAQVNVKENEIAGLKRDLAELVETNRRAESKLQTAGAALRERDETIQAKHAALAKLEEDVKRAQTAQASSLAALQAQQRAFAQVQSDFVILKDKIAERDEKIFALNQAVDEKATLIAELRRAEGEMRAAFTSTQAAFLKRQGELQTALRLRDQHCIELEGRVAEERERALRAETETERVSEQAARDLEHLTLRLKAEFAEEREQTVREAGDARAVHEAEVRALREDLEKSRAAVERGEEALAERIREIAARDGEYESLKREFERLATGADELRAQLQTQTEKEIAAEGEIHSLQRGLAQMTESSLRKEAQITALFAQIGEKDKQIEKLRADGEAERQVWREEKARMQAELDDKQALAGSLAALQTELAEERRHVRKLLEIRDEHIAGEQKSSDKKSNQLRQREAQLRHYAQILSGEKSELSRLANQLIREIRAAQAANPLADYLAVTQFELTKLEIQLKTTPAISQQRPALEESLAKLIQQKEFLVSTMNASKDAAERQLQSLNRIVGTGVLAPLPPLPMKTSGENAE